MYWNCTYNYIIHYICVRSCPRVFWGGRLPTRLAIQDFLAHIWEICQRYWNWVFRTSSKYLPLCRLSLQNNHEIWSFRHRTTSYSTVPPYVGRITSSVIRSIVNNWYLQESRVLCKFCSSCIYPSNYLCAVQVVRVLRSCMRHDFGHPCHIKEYTVTRKSHITSHGLSYL